MGCTFSIQEDTPVATARHVEVQAPSEQSARRSVSFGSIAPHANNSRKVADDDVY
jgi:hypothetical protein